MWRTILSIAMAAALTCAPVTAAVAQPRCSGRIIDPSASEPVRHNPDADCHCYEGLNLVTIDFGPNGEIYLTLTLHCLIQ